MAILKPFLEKIWGSAATGSDLDNPTDPKWASGWVFGEKPPNGQMNWIQWTLTKAFAHLNEYGVLEHDLVTVYPLGAYVWKDGKVYRSRVAANENNVVTLPTKWQEQSLPDMPTSGDGFILYYSGSQLFWKDHHDLDYGTYQGRVAADHKSYVMVSDNTLGNDPQVTEINIGELAINFKDKTLFTKNPEGVIIPISGQASIVDYDFVATAGQTQFVPPGGYTVGQIEVAQNGRKLPKNAYVANDGINVNLVIAAELDDDVIITVWASFGLADAYTQVQVDALLAAKQVEIDAVEAQLVGVNQTWQDVLASRSANTEYVNNTGKPIVVSAQATIRSGSTGSSLALLVDGVTASRTATSSGTASVQINDEVSALVPNGSTYEIVSTTAIDFWSELRA